MFCLNNLTAVSLTGTCYQFQRNVISLRNHWDFQIKNFIIGNCKYSCVLHVIYFASKQMQFIAIIKTGDWSNANKQVRIIF